MANDTCSHFPGLMLLFGPAMLSNDESTRFASFEIVPKTMGLFWRKFAEVVCESEGKILVFPAFNQYNSVQKPSFHSLVGKKCFRRPV